MMDKFFMTRIFLQMMDLFHIASRPQLFQKEVDADYLIHCLLKELFQNNSPSPFAVINENDSYIELLGYSSKPAKELKEIAENNRSRKIFNAIDWNRFSSKAMPSEFSKNLEYIFRLRACPVVRKGRSSDNFKAGAEVDVFLSEIEKKPEDETLSREAVYRKWLINMFNRYDIEIVSQIRLTKMKLSRFIRRNSTRETQTITRPDVIFEGKLKINDSQVFKKQLRKGFGRHNAFGFGMLLLR